MAGAGQPWFMPLLWPVGHVSDSLRRPEDDKPAKPVPTPDLDLTGHATAVIAALRSFGIAVALIYGLYGPNKYPAFGRAKELSFDWMCKC